MSVVWGATAEGRVPPATFPETGVALTLHMVLGILLPCCFLHAHELNTLLAGSESFEALMLPKIRKVGYCT